MRCGKWADIVWAKICPSLASLVLASCAFTARHPVTPTEKVSMLSPLDAAPVEDGYRAVSPDGRRVVKLSGMDEGKLRMQISGRLGLHPQRVAHLGETADDWGGLSVIQLLWTPDSLALVATLHMAHNEFTGIVRQDAGGLWIFDPQDQGGVSQQPFEITWTPDHRLHLRIGSVDGERGDPRITQSVTSFDYDLRTGRQSHFIVRQVSLKTYLALKEEVRHRH